MTSLYIKDPDTAGLVARVARRLGMTKTALVRELAAAREVELDRGERSSSPERLRKFWRDHPLPPPTGLAVDKSFYDELSGNL